MDMLTVDPVLLATASLAQVHRATLRCKNPEDGRNEVRDIVVKAQHRSVASLMRQDMENLRTNLATVACLEAVADFEPVVREYNQEVRRELDFRIEAVNMEAVRHTLLSSSSSGGDDNDDDEESPHKVIIPRSLWYSGRLLLMDYCPGFPVIDTEALDQHRFDRRLLLRRICSAWPLQMHVGGLFNADPHSGNILVSTAANSADASVPVLLDFGLTKRFGDDTKRAFAVLIHATDETDVDAMLTSFRDIGMKLYWYDPFEDMASMQRAFADPETPPPHTQSQ